MARAVVHAAEEDLDPQRMVLADQDAAVRASSPTDLVRPDLPPTLVMLGSADHVVVPDLVRGDDRALRDDGVPGRLLEVPHADHVSDHPFGSPGTQLTRPAVAAFPGEHVGVRGP